MPFFLDVFLPRSGAPVRLDLVGVQWVLERTTQGVHCVAMDGDLLYEGLLGLPEDGGLLRFEACPPDNRLEITLQSALVVAPRGKLRGYLALPMDQRLSFVPGEQGSESLELVLVRDRYLRAGWREGEGYFHPWTCSFLPAPRRESVPGGRRVWIRTFIENRGSNVERVRRCRLQLAGYGVELLRGMIFGPAVVWTLGRGGGLILRSLPSLTKRDDTNVLRADFQGFGEVAS